MKVLKGKNEMPMNIAQRIDEKSGVICLGLTFTIGVMTNKMLNWYQKVSRSLSKIFICIRNILFSSFRKCYGLLDSQLPLTRCQPLKTQGFCIFCELSTFSCISILVISGMVTPKPLTIPFPEDFNKIYQVHLNIIPKLWIMFCCHQQKILKTTYFWLFNDHNFGCT